MEELSPTEAWKIYKSYGDPRLEQAQDWLDYFLLRAIEEGMRTPPSGGVEDMVQIILQELSPHFKKNKKSSPHLPLQGRLWRIFIYLQELQAEYMVLSNAQGFTELLIHLIEFLMEILLHSRVKDEAEMEGRSAQRLTEHPVSFHEALDLWRDLESKYNLNPIDFMHHHHHHYPPFMSKSSSATLHPSESSLSIKRRSSSTSYQSRRQLRRNSRFRFRNSKDANPNQSKFIHILSKPLGDDSDSNVQETASHPSGSRLHYIPQNPLDFDYFDMVLRSSDESNRINDWRRSIRNGFPPVVLSPPRSAIMEERLDVYDLYIAIISISNKLIDRETRVRNLKTSYYVALLIASFVCERLSVLLDDPRKPLDLILPLLKLLVTSLAELTFTARENSQVIILTSLSCFSRTFYSQGPPEPLLQMQTCVLRIIYSLSKGGGSKLTFQSLFEKGGEDAFVQALVRNDDFHQTLQMICFHSEEISPSDIREYFSELKKVLLAYKGTCLSRGETVNLHSAYRSLMIFYPELIKLFGLDFILPLLQLSASCILCANPSFAWECILMRSPIPLREDIYNVVERIVTHFSWNHFNRDPKKRKGNSSTASSPVSSSNNASRFSDSDSAFGTSENSFESKETFRFGEYASTLSTYLLLMERCFQDEDALMDLMDHIMRLFNLVNPVLNKKIFVDVIIPALRIYKNHKILSSFCLDVISSCVKWETKFKGNPELSYHELSLQNNVPSLALEIIESQGSVSAYKVYAALASVELCKIAFDMTHDYFRDCVPEDIMIRHPKYARVVKSTSENPTVRLFVEMVSSTERLNEDLHTIWEEVFQLLVNFPHFKSFCLWNGLAKIASDAVEPNITNVTVVSVLLKVLIQLSSAKAVLNPLNPDAIQPRPLEECLESVVEYYVVNAPHPDYLRPIVKEVFLVNFVPKKTPLPPIASPIFEREDFFDNNTHFFNSCSQEDLCYDASDEYSGEERDAHKPAHPLFLAHKTINKHKVVVQNSFNFIAAMAQQFPSVAQYGISFWVRACKVDSETRSFIDQLQVQSFLIEEFKNLLMDGKSKYMALIESLVSFLEVTTLDFRLRKKDLINLIDVFKCDTVPSALPILKLFKTISQRVSNPLIPKYSILFSSIKNYRFRTRIPNYYAIDLSFIIWLKCRGTNGTVFTFDSESGFFLGVDLNPEQKNVFVYLSRNFTEAYTITFYSKGLLPMDWNHITVSLSPSKGDLNVIVNGTQCFPNKSAKYPVPKGKGLSQVITLFPSAFEYSDIRMCKGFLKEEESLSFLLRGHQHRGLCPEFILKQFPDLLKIHPTMKPVVKEEILIAHFDPQNPKQLLVYDQENDNVPSSLLPPSIVTNLCSDSVIDNHKSRLWDIIGETGGIGTLLLLEARILELQLPDELFATGLEILINVALGSFEAKEDFELVEGFILLFSLLDTPRIGLFTLSVIINKSLNEDLISFDAHRFTIDWREVEKGPLLIYPQLVELIFGIPNLFKHKLDDPAYRELKNDGIQGNCLFDVVVKYIGRLVEFSNDYHAFNHRQLWEVNFDSRLMHYLKESCIEDETFYLDKSIVEDLGDIFGTLIGSPPNLNMLQNVMRHCLFLHDPLYTFVSHAKSSIFYQSSDPRAQKSSPSLPSNEEKMMEEPHTGEECTAHTLDESSMPWGGRSFDDEKSCSFKSEDISLAMEAEIHRKSPIEGKLSELLRKLLNVLGNSLINSPDSSTSRISDIFPSEHLLAWVNHPHPGVRSEAVNLINCWLQRSVVKNDKIYFLLANQLISFPVSEEIVNRCLDVAHKMIGFNLYENPSSSFYEDEGPSIHPPSAIIPLLSLLPHTPQDLPLAHGLISHLHKVLARDLSTLKTLVRQFELCPVLLSTLKAVTETENLCTDICGQDSREILSNDLSNLFGLITYSHVLEARNESFEAFEGFLNVFLSEIIHFSHPFLTKAFMNILEESLQLLQTTIYGLDNTSIYNSRQKNSVLSPIIFSNKEEELEAHPSESSTVEGRKLKFFKQNGETANRAQMATRFSKLYKLAGDYVLCATLRSECTFSVEESFFQALVVFSLTELSSISERPKFRSIVPKEDLKSMTMKLLSFGLSPLVPLELRIQMLILLSKPKDFHSLIKLGNSPIYLIKELIQNHSQLMSESHRDLCFDLLKDLEDVFRKLPFSQEVLDGILLGIQKQKVILQGTLEEKKGTSGLEKLVESLTDLAVKYTKSVMKAQYVESKDYIQSIRSGLIDKVKAQRGWKSIVEQLTHEMGPWIFEKHRPRSWYLGEVEGSQRMRIRLEKRQLCIPKKHYLPEHSHKGRSYDDEEESPKGPPFQFLLKGPLGMSEIIIDKLNSDHCISLMEQCILILPDDRFEGEILVGNKALYYVNELFTMTWYLEDIKEFHLRRYELKEIGVELFLNEGVTRFLVFNSKESRSEFVNKVFERLPHLSETPDPSAIMKMWQDGLITNFEYLMELNKLAGRSFNDLMQYPIYPFVLVEYKSDFLDLTTEDTFRNLRKPVSIQKSEKERKYRDTYETLEKECLARQREVEFAGVDLGPYHYGSHYSNSGIVLYFLQRLPPFTNLFLKFQDGNFDLPDRTFHSLADTWRLASEDSATDVKELLPDLYCLPELLINEEGLNFGIRQNGEVVNDVDIPPWSGRNPRMFIKIHRQALESNYVRENLCHWIDLVFGYKQSGQAAIDAFNVFHPATYYGFNVDSITDPLQRSARIAMIQTYGQTPKQLFVKPHPMVKMDLIAKRDASRTVLESVKGLRWGNYIGSPDEKDPVIIWSSSIKKLACKLVPMTHNRVFGLPGIASLAQVKGPSDYGVIYWNSSNHRLYSQFKGVKKNTYLSEEVTTLGVCSRDMSVWIGSSSGKISVYPLDKALNLKVEEGFRLYAHSSEIVDLSVCSSFGMVASASKDGTLVFWDIKTRSFIRSLKVEKEADIQMIQLSSTCGDLAVISSEGEFSSRLSLSTLNGSPVGSVILEPLVSALCFSSAPEGVSVNAIATGHCTGLIRLWSAWDLSPIRDIPSSQIYPILSLAFSLDNQHLYASTINKEVIVFEKAESKGFKHPPKYLYCDDSGDSILLDCCEPRS